VGQDPFSVATSRKAAYLWTGGAGIVLIVVLACTVAGFVSRQMRLTRLKNDLIATVSHELKTPLASMRMLVDTLLEGRYRDQDRVREYLQLVGRENQRLSRLIDNFLAFSRMERNKHAFQFTEVEVGEIVAAAVEAVQDRFAAPCCQLEVDVAPDLPAVFGDRDALTTVLLNLLDNAHKYTRDDKHVRIRAYTQDSQAVIEVRDNGIGIPRRAQRRIFDRFYQVDQSLTRKAGGCGLGLSIVQFIVTAHGGSIAVASDVASGTTFTVRLPAAPECRHHRKAEHLRSSPGQEDRDGI
jgi:signal transduction histidine kinase